MRVLAAFFSAILVVSGSAASAQQTTISWELERGFRFFKYNSDFEFQRLAYRDFQASHLGKAPDVIQLDSMLNDLDWQDHDIPAKLAAWYGHAGAVSPIDLLREWRKEERSQGRPQGYLELADRLKAENLQYWEYHPARIGWASLLFPSHQDAGDIGTGKLTRRRKSRSAGTGEPAPHQHDASIRISCRSSTA